jgi:hypothetical protein
MLGTKKMNLKKENCLIESMRMNRREIDRERMGERSLLQGFPFLEKSHYSIHQVFKNLNMLPAIHVSFWFIFVMLFL